jgi:hypothetical protein
MYTKQKCASYIGSVGEINAVGQEHVLFRFYCDQIQLELKESFEIHLLHLSSLHVTAWCICVVTHTKPSCLSFITV